VLHALVLAAQALPVGDRAKDSGAEQSVPLRFEGAVVDGLGLGDFATRLMRMASKSAITFAISKGLERNKVFLRFLRFSRVR
jgi:hypothetical protein